MNFNINTDFDEATENEIKIFIQNSIEFLESSGIRTNLLDEIIVTNKYEEGVIAVNQKYGSSQTISKGRSFVSYIKSIFNFNQENPKYSIVIRDRLFLLESARNILLQQIVGIDTDWDLPQELREKNTYLENSPYELILEVLLQQGVSEVIKLAKCQTLDCLTQIDNNSQVQIFEEFKRKIKKIHLQYQSDHDLGAFWIDIVREIDKYNRFCTERHLIEGIKLNGHDVESIMSQIADAFISTAKEIENYKHYIDTLKDGVDKLLKYCFVEIKQNDPIYILIETDPKYLFKGELLDTEPRILGFTDILGFGDIVQDYEKDPSLNTLEKLHTALNNAIKYGIDSIVNATEFHRDLFDFKLFSDCLCVSIPYFDNDDDFTYQFAFISQVLKFYQLFMLHELFFIRGGISFGNYYSDDNMIFSDALVQAYILESKKADKPRIIVDPRIIERIGKNIPKEFIEFGISKLFIIEKENPDYVFLNPFNLVDGLGESMAHLSSLLDNNFTEDDSDPFNKLGKSAQKLLNLTMDYSKKMIESTYDEQELLNKLLEEVMIRIQKYKDVDSVRLKYEWYLRLVQYNLKMNDDFEHYFKKE